MSTVAYKDGVIASDTQITNGNEVQYGISKVGRTRYFLFGFVGRMGAMQPCFDWIMAAEQQEDVRELGPEYLYRYADELPVDDDEGTILLANANGCWNVTPGGYVSPHPRGWESIGSGGTYAVGAMQFGATAQEAIGVAMELDTGTGGGVVVSYSLKPTDRSPLKHVVKPGLIKP